LGFSFPPTDREGSHDKSPHVGLSTCTEKRPEGSQIVRNVHTVIFYHMHVAGWVCSAQYKVP